MAESKLKSKIESGILPLRAGIVMNSYYDKRGGNAMYVDIILDDDKTKQQLTRVPMVKIGGLSSVLPPVGSTAIISYIDNSEERPVVLGYIESQISQVASTDNIAPRKPPTHLTR